MPARRAATSIEEAVHARTCWVARSIERTRRRAPPSTVPTRHASRHGTTSGYHHDQAHSPAGSRACRREVVQAATSWSSEQLFDQVRSCRPAAPVTSQPRRWLHEPVALLQAFTLPPCEDEFLQQGPRRSTIALGEAREHRLARRRAHRSAQALVGERGEPLDQRARVARGKRKPSAPGRTIPAAPPMSESTTGRPSAIASSAASEGLHRGAAERDRVARREERTHVLLHAGDQHLAGEAERARARLDRRPHRAVADQKRARGDAACTQMRQRFDELQVVLLRAQHRAHADRVVSLSPSTCRMRSRTSAPGERQYSGSIPL